MDNNILEAIKAGEAVLAEKEKEAQAKKLKEQEERRRYIQSAQLQAEKWAKEVLPDIIRNETANGKREHYLGSSDSDSWDFLPSAKAGEAEKLGLKIRTVRYEEYSGDEGAYAHGAGWSYYITW